MKLKILAAAVSAAAILGIGFYIATTFKAPSQATNSEAHMAALRSFVEAANEASGIQTGDTFNYSFVGYGNNANFGILRCVSEVRCDPAVERQVAKFQQPNQPSPDSADVDVASNQVVSFHRAVPSVAGSEYSQTEIEAKVREFLGRVYPDFKATERTLTFAPGMKGVRLNNGNYIYRWEDRNYKLPDGLSTNMVPFVQVDITASGFIFGYDNTITMYHDALKDL